MPLSSMHTASVGMRPPNTSSGSSRRAPPHRSPSYCSPRRPTAPCGAPRAGAGIFDTCWVDEGEFFACFFDDPEDVDLQFEDDEFEDGVQQARRLVEDFIGRFTT